MVFESELRYEEGERGGGREGREDWRRKGRRNRKGGPAKCVCKETGRGGGAEARPGLPAACLAPACATSCNLRHQLRCQSTEHLLKIMSMKNIGVKCRLGYKVFSLFALREGGS